MSRTIRKVRANLKRQNTKRLEIANDLDLWQRKEQEFSLFLLGVPESKRNNLAATNEGLIFDDSEYID